MKRLVDLLRVNESRFTAIILGAMTIAAVINFNGQLGSGGGVPCLYDVYIIGILRGGYIWCSIAAVLYIICRKA